MKNSDGHHVCTVWNHAKHVVESENCVSFYSWDLGISTPEFVHQSSVAEWLKQWANLGMKATPE